MLVGTIVLMSTIVCLVGKILVTAVNLDEVIVTAFYMSISSKVPLQTIYFLLFSELLILNLVVSKFKA